jgi:hypothetical protein
MAPASALFPRLSAREGRAPPIPKKDAARDRAAPDPAARRWPVAGAAAAGDRGYRRRAGDRAAARAGTVPPLTEPEPPARPQAAARGPARGPSPGDELQGAELGGRRNRPGP